MSKCNHWPQPALKTCIVMVRPHGKSPALRQIKVQAQYYRIVEGALIFRNHRADTYPDTVRVFAPGYWLEVVPQ